MALGCNWDLLFWFFFSLSDNLWLLGFFIPILYYIKWEKIVNNACHKFPHSPRWHHQVDCFVRATLRNKKDKPWGVMDGGNPHILTSCRLFFTLFDDWRSGVDWFVFFSIKVFCFSCWFPFPFVCRPFKFEILPSQRLHQTRCATVGRQHNEL